jgi:hypothetical protein
VVGGDGLFDMLGEVVPQMPPIGYLDRLRCPASGPLGVSAGAVTADHLGARVLP